MNTLYGAKHSGSLAIEIALRHCDLPYRLVRAASWGGKAGREELARVNPLVQIPTLVLPDGQVLTESAAILIHLGLANPGSGLLARRNPRRAQQIRGLVFIAANCYSAIGIRDYPERWTGIGGKRDRERVRKGARRLLHRNWEIFADTFPADPFLCGKAPGALDYLAAVVTKWSGTRSHLAQARPQFHELLLKVEKSAAAREPFRAHWG